MRTDKLKMDMLALAELIKGESCPEKKAELLNQARLLVACSEKQRKSEARKRVDYLHGILPKMFVRFPDALTRIANKSAGHEKFLPHIDSLKRGQSIQSEINTLVDKFGLDMPKATKEKRHKKNARTKWDGRLINKKAEGFARKKFDRLNNLNKTSDDKEESMEHRRAHVKGKANYVLHETGFNGVRRNDQLTNNRLSWNEKQGKIAGCKGAR